MIQVDLVCRHFLFYNIILIAEYLPSNYGESALVNERVKAYHVATNKEFMIVFICCYEDQPVPFMKFVLLAEAISDQLLSTQLETCRVQKIQSEH